MNNYERLKIKELKEEEEQKLNELKQIKSLLYYYRNSFNQPESIKALKRIKKYLTKYYERFEEIDRELKDILEKLSANCSHSILINRKCPMCQKRFNEQIIPNTTEYTIEDHSFYKEENNIYNMVKNCEQEEDVKKQLLDYYDNLQYIKNVKIKRLVK